jgi:hypothetical protein
MSVKHHGGTMSGWDVTIAVPPSFTKPEREIAASVERSTMSAGGTLAEQRAKDLVPVV